MKAWPRNPAAAQKDTLSKSEEAYMLYRVILRVSYTADTGSIIRNALLPFMTSAGLVNTGTGTWESEATELSVASASLASILTELGGLDDPNGSFLKHVWIYIDRPRPSEPDGSMKHISSALQDPEEG
jgi:hypothetical protein